MCLILFAHRVHPDYPLILTANRDEFHDRPTSPLAPWPDSPGIIGGRDLRSGGTWLAVRPPHRWSAVTNYRSPADMVSQGPSRGRLVADFVAGDDGPADYLEQLVLRQADYAGFNLLAGDGTGVWWLSNRADSSIGPVEVPSGVHGLSNHLLDSTWPKVELGKERLGTAISQPDALSPDLLLTILADSSTAADGELPSTGVPIELERALSAAFISVPDYGTRASTVLLIGPHGGGTITERRFDSHGLESGTTRLTFQSPNC